MQSTVWECRQAPEELLDWLHGRMVSANHVEHVIRSEGRLDVVSSTHPGWVVWVCVLFFPLGLLALLAKERRTLLIRVEPSGSGSRVRIDGATTPGVRHMLVDVWNALQPTVVPVAA